MEIVILFQLIFIAVLFVRKAAYKIGAEALVIYMKEKEYTPPSKDETKECMKKAIKSKFKIRNDF